MGNCYVHEDQGYNVTVQKQTNQRAHAHANYDQENERNSPAEHNGSLNNFVNSIPREWSLYYNEEVHKILERVGGPLDFTAKPTDPSFSFSDFEYRENVLADGYLYAGLINLGNLQPDGYGVKVAINDGTIYEGFFRGGVFDGWGRKISSNGEIYEGEWMNGFRHGQGIEINNEGTRHEGQWSNDEKNGHGIESWTDGAIYEGQYENGKKVGQGYFRWADGSTYQGTFQENMIQGFGEYRWADGRHYKGDWLNNKMHGKGVF